jgi:NodT family efflux transporter outer membrane factor (OMF) lipoprotein
MNSLRGLVPGLAITLLAGCAVGPNYQRPVVEVSANYKEQGDWKPSEPADVLDRGAWWEVYQDDVLSALAARVEISNENVKAAAAAVEQAQALEREARAGFWPTISGSWDRQRTATGNLAARTVSDVGVDATWSLDIWGQIRRSTQGSAANAQASEAALAAARLDAQSQLVSGYFQLRTQDQLQALLDDTVTAQQASLRITESRYRFGVAAKADVVSAQAQLLTSQAQRANAAIQRGLLEHAIAVLVGQEPATFSLSPAPLRSNVPVVPAGLPSTLLERRPDIAEAERKVAAASAQIGVARGAFFPNVSLSGSDAYKSGVTGALISASNRVWAFGPALAQTLFAGGLRRAQEAEARAAFDGSVDIYRQTVLLGLEQVEDQIITLRVLEQQSALLDSAVAAAREAEKLTLNQYKAGTVPYSSVISAQTARLNNEVTALTVLSNRLTASVTMIEALGGGWSAARLR